MRSASMASSAAGSVTGLDTSIPPHPPRISDGRRLRRACYAVPLRQLTRHNAAQCLIAATILQVGIPLFVALSRSAFVARW